MRFTALVPVSLAVLIACSSGADDEPACQIAGTYTTRDKKASGTCEDVGDEPTTWTVSGNVTDGYVVALGGATGGCTAESVGACKIQGKCDTTAQEPTDPTNDMGTIQFSWTFTAKGFDGSTIISVPPSKPVPAGCTSEYATTATRK